MEDSTQTAAQPEPTAPLTGSIAPDLSIDGSAMLKRKRAKNDTASLPATKVGPSEAGPAARTRSRVQNSDARDVASSKINATDATGVPDVPRSNADQFDSVEMDTGMGKRRTKSSTPKKVDPSQLHSGKPEPSGNPQVWSDSRAALCNALDYFRCHQGGTYSKNNVAVGLLIDAKVGDNDLFSSQVVITAM